MHSATPDPSPQLTKIVSFFRLPCTASNEFANATPSKSSSKMRMRFSEPCWAKCSPSNEYQYSNSFGELIASHILIWSSMNCNLTACRQAPFVLWKMEIDFRCNWAGMNGQVLVVLWFIQLTRLWNRVWLAGNSVTPTVLNQVGRS